MSTWHRSAGLVAALCWCGACWGAPGAAAPASAAAPSREALARLEEAWRRIEPAPPSLGVRDLFSFVLEAAAADAMPQQVARALGLAEQMQDRDPNSRTYGNFRWYWRAEKPEDLNAVEFCMQKAALVWLLHRDRLDGEPRERMERLIGLSIEGIRRHRVGESYTNIFLMKTWNCIALGEATARADLAREGYEMLDRWLMHTWEGGVREYVSPTYYGVDVECLALLARWSSDGGVRAKAEAALRLMWTDIAANWFDPCGRLGGAHSRDYDYTTGHGHLDVQLRDVGWIPRPEGRAATAFQELSRWVPPEGLVKPILDSLPRTVHQRWGAEPGRAATNYLGRTFSLGTGGSCYGPEDKVLTIQLAGGGPRAPMGYFLMDVRDDPFGSRKFTTGGGHSKAHHAVPFVMTVQRGPEALLLAVGDPNDARFKRYTPEMTCLLSRVVLPSPADVWIGDRPVPPAAVEGAAPVNVPEDTPVFLRSAGAAVGLRLAAVGPGEGPPAPVAFAGGAVLRHLTCTHSAGPPRARAAAALWVRCAEGLDDAGFAAFRRGFWQPWEIKATGTRVEVAAPGLAGPLRLAADAAGGGRRLAAEGGPKGAEELLLAVNGRDHGREILRQVDPIARYERALAAARAGAADAPQPGQTIEAEAAALIVLPFRVDEDPGASGGRFVWVPGEPGGKGAGAAGRALWLIHVPAPGAYRLEARVQTPTSSDDSFYVRIGQGDRDVLPRTDWQPGVHARWQWLPVRAGREAQARAVTLQRGVVVVEFSAREDGSRLDALRLLAADATGG